MITENFDFSGMSEIDYTDTFADIDLAAEIIGNFTNALRRDLRLTNNLIPDNFDVGASDLISMDDVKNIGNILSWDAEKVIRRFEVHKLFCTVILRPGEGGLIDFNTRFGIPWRITSKSNACDVRIITGSLMATAGAPFSVDGEKCIQARPWW